MCDMIALFSSRHTLHMSRFANNAFLGGGARVRVRVGIREKRTIKRQSCALLSL